MTGDTQAREAPVPDGRQHLVITHEDIRPAYGTIGPYLRRTPVVQLDLTGPVTLKLEQLQCAGSFQGPRRVAVIISGANMTASQLDG